MDQNGFSAHFDAIHARHGPQHRLVRTGQSRPDDPAGGQALDLPNGSGDHLRPHGTQQPLCF